VGGVRRRSGTRHAADRSFPESISKGRISIETQAFVVPESPTFVFNRRIGDLALEEKRGVLRSYRIGHMPWSFRKARSTSALRISCFTRFSTVSRRAETSGLASLNGCSSLDSSTGIGLLRGVRGAISPYGSRDGRCGVKAVRMWRASSLAAGVEGRSGR